MDWKNESWVKLYTRTTAELVAIGWESRALLWELMRVCDRSGHIDTADPDEIALLCHMPSHVVTACHRVLLGRGIISECDGGLIITNFHEAQSSRTSAKERQRRSRESKKAEGAHVTACHSMSQGVTGRHDKIDRVDRIDEREGAREKWSKLAQQAWQQLNDVRSVHGLRSLGLAVPPGIGADILARIGEQTGDDGDTSRAEAAIAHVIAVAAAEAAVDPDQAKWLTGSLFSEKSFGLALGKDPDKVRGSAKPQRPERRIVSTVAPREDNPGTTETIDF